MLQFTHPALIFGTLAFLVPLIIHLLNRQRFRRRQWAAMEFLLAAYKKQRRRVRTENLLLLLLRCLIPILLAMAIARPLLKSAAGFVGLTGAAHHVLILDSTYSMGAEPAGTQSPFAQTKLLATRLLDRIAGRSGHKVSLIVAGVRPTTPIVDDLNIARAKAQLAMLARPQDAASDLLPALRAAAELIDSGADPEYRVYLFTDLQTRALALDKLGDKPKPAADAVEPAPATGDPAKASFEDNARDLIDRLAKRAEVHLYDVGPRDSASRVDNLQVQSLGVVDSLVIAKVPVPVKVGLLNRASAARSVQVTLEIDGGSPARQQVQIEAGAELSVEFPVTFREVGLRTLKASIEGDGLEADDARYAVVPVRDRVRMLLVEGSEETEAALQEASHLRAVLDPTGGEGPAELTPFAPRTIDAAQFWSSTEPLDTYDLIALCNVETIPPEVADRLKHALQAGSSLLVILGNRVKPDAYNAQLYAAGTGPLPLQLGDAQGFIPLGRDSYGTEILDNDHPVFADLSKEFRDVFQQIPIYKYVSSDPASLHKDARVLARLRDPRQSPLLVVGNYGEGKVALLTTSISRRPDRWNDLQIEMIAFQLLHPLARWLTVPMTNPYNTEVGGVLTTALREKPRDVAYLVAERAGAMRSPVPEDSRLLAGNRYSLPAWRDTGFAGLYVADMQVERDGVLTPRQIPFAVNVDPIDGALDYAAHSAIREKLGIDKIHRDLPADANTPIDAGRSELGPLLLLATLIFLLSEAALARYVSTRRG